MSEKLVFMDTPNLKKWLTELDSLSTTGIDEAVKAGLLESKRLITQQLEAEMEKHYRTGITIESLDTTQKVYVEGYEYYVSVGFHISQGGLASIFLMKGTPKQAPDTHLYEAVFGKETARKVRKIQMDEVKLVMRKYLGDFTK